MKGQVLHFTIPGKPQGKGRARATARGGFARMYTPKKTVDYMNAVKAAFLKAYPGHKPWDGPVMLGVKAYFDVPKSWSKARRRQAEAIFMQHIAKPDLSNIVKGIEDALNGAVYVDDSQICRYATSYKKYSTVCAYVDVVITRIAQEDGG